MVWSFDFSSGQKINSSISLVIPFETTFKMYHLGFKRSDKMDESIFMISSGQKINSSISLVTPFETTFKMNHLGFKRSDKMDELIFCIPH